MTASETATRTSNAVTSRREHVGQIGDFPLGEIKLVMFGHTEVGVIRTSSGWYAMRNHCPHMGADICRGQIVGSVLPSEPDEFEYDPDALAVQCPWHRWEWSLDDGQALGRVTNRRLGLYDVHLEGDAVYVAPHRRRTRKGA